MTQPMGRMGMLALILSYGDTIALNLTVDKDLELFEPKEFVNLFEEVLEKEIFTDSNDLK